MDVHPRRITALLFFVVFAFLPFLSSCDSIGGSNSQEAIWADLQSFSEFEFNIGENRTLGDIFTGLRYKAFDQGTGYIIKKYQS